MKAVSQHSPPSLAACLRLQPGCNLTHKKDPGDYVAQMKVCRNRRIRLLETQHVDWGDNGAIFYVTTLLHQENDCPWQQ